MKEKSPEAYKKHEERCEFRIAEDSCVICGAHAKLGGGHLFKGIKLVEYEGIEWYLDDYGWLSTGYIWICPDCQTKLRRILKFLEDKSSCI
jgi:hypothetical protein